jgi:hypothetical protein
MPAARTAVRVPNWWGLVFGIACACNVGAPLVDKLQPGDPPIAPVACTPAPPCKPLEPIESSTRRALALTLDDCVGSACAPLLDAGLADQPDDAGPNQPLKMRGLRGDKLVTGCDRALSQLPSQISCDAMRIAYAADARDIALDAPDWSHGNLSISAQTPLQIELHAARLTNLFVQLSGPVLLRIDHAAQLDDVRIRGTQSADGAPGVELLQASGQGVAIGDTELAFAGALSLRDVTLTDAVLASDQLELQSVSLAKAHVVTQLLTGTDVRLTDTQLEADSALLSAFSALRARLRFCDGATLVAGELRETGLAGCAGGGALRLYKSTILASALDGAIESDASHWETTRVGASADSTLLLFESDVASTRFCDALSKLALGYQSHITCSHCQHAFAQPDQLCSIPAPGPATTYDANACPELTDKPAPAACSEPLPERVRPPLDAM